VSGWEEGESRTALMPAERYGELCSVSNGLWLRVKSAGHHYQCLATVWVSDYLASGEDALGVLDSGFGVHLQQSIRVHSRLLSWQHVSIRLLSWFRRFSAAISNHVFKTLHLGSIVFIPSSTERDVSVALEVVASPSMEKSVARWEQVKSPAGRGISGSQYAERHQLLFGY